MISFSDESNSLESTNDTLNQSVNNQIQLQQAQESRFQEPLVEEIQENQSVYQIQENPKKNSTIWEKFRLYFKYIPDEEEEDKKKYYGQYGLCLYCRKFIKYAASDTSLHNHIRDKHIKDLTNAKEISIYQKKLQQRQQNYKEKKKIVKVKDGRQSKLTEFTSTEEKNPLTQKQKYDTYREVMFDVIMMIVYDFEPIALVSRIGFSRFFTKAYPTFVMPSERKLKRLLIRTANIGRDMMRDYIQKSIIGSTITINFDHTSTLQRLQYITTQVYCQKLDREKPIIIHLKTTIVEGEKATDIKKDVEQVLSFYGFINLRMSEETEDNVNELAQMMTENKPEVQNDCYLPENGEDYDSDDSRYEGIENEEYLEENESFSILEQQQQILNELKDLEEIQLEDVEQIDFDFDFEREYEKFDEFTQYKNPLFEFYACSDGARANIKANKLMDFNVVLLVCINHIIHNSVCATKKLLDLLCGLLDRVNWISQHFRRSILDYNLLKKIVRELNNNQNKTHVFLALKIIKATRWRCIGGMIRAFIFCFDGIEKFYNRNYPNILEHKVDRDEVLDLKDCLYYFDQLEEISLLFEYETPTTSYILTTYYQIQEIFEPCENDSELLYEFKEIFLEQFNNRFENYYLSNAHIKFLLAKCSFLNPNICLSQFKAYDEDLFQIAYEMLLLEMLQYSLWEQSEQHQKQEQQNQQQRQSDLLIQEQSDDLENESLHYNGENNNYQEQQKKGFRFGMGKKKVKISQKDSNIYANASSFSEKKEILKKSLESQLFQYLRICENFSEKVEKGKPPYNFSTITNFNVVDYNQFWKRQKDQGNMRELSLLAEKYGSILSSSSPSEREFSSLWNLVTKKRVSLSPELVEDILFLRSNLIKKNLDESNLEKKFIEQVSMKNCFKE